MISLAGMPMSSNATRSKAGLTSDARRSTALADVTMPMMGPINAGVGVNSKPKRVPYRPERIAAREGAHVAFAA